VRHLLVLSETLRHPDVRVALRFDLLDVERRNFRVGSRRANLVDPRLRISLVDDDERIHLGEVIAAMLLVSLIARNIIEEENTRSILESSDDFDLGHNRRHIRFHDELVDLHVVYLVLGVHHAPEIHRRHVAELGLSDTRIADDSYLRGVVHFDYVLLPTQVHKMISLVSGLMG
jgi:hypothetical protein